MRARPHRPRYARWMGNLTDQGTCVRAVRRESEQDWTLSNHEWPCLSRSSLVRSFRSLSASRQDPGSATAIDWARIRVWRCWARKHRSTSACKARSPYSHAASHHRLRCVEGDDIVQRCRCTLVLGRDSAHLVPLDPTPNFERRPSYESILDDVAMVSAPRAQCVSVHKTH